MQIVDAKAPFMLLDYVYLHTQKKNFHSLLVMLTQNQQPSIFYRYFCEFDMNQVCTGQCCLQETAICSHSGDRH